DIDAPHVAIDANHRRQARGQMQVRGLVLDRKGQKFGDIHRVPRSPLDKTMAGHASRSRAGTMYQHMRMTPPQNLRWRTPRNNTAKSSRCLKVWDCLQGDCV